MKKDGGPYALDIAGLSHTFKKHRALTDISFQVDAQAIHGFVGPNGAGKTTTLKIVSTLLEPQRGRVRVFDNDIVKNRKLVRNLIGFMPDHFSMYRQMTVFEYLDFFGAAYGLSVRQRNQIIADVLALTDMSARQHDLISGLSRGMQQRVSLARILVNDPKLLLLDEPASGLDPRARIELMEILRELRQLGKTIFISSHILSELGDLCDSVTIIDRGRIKYSGTMAGLLKRGGATLCYELMFTAESPELEAAFEAIPGVTAVRKLDAKAEYFVSFDPAQVNTTVLIEAAIREGAELVHLRESQRQLNQVFMDLTEPGVRQ